VIAADAVLLQKVQRLSSVQHSAWEHLQGLLHQSLCLLQFMNNVQAS
jgi:hypothetical protein